MRRSSSSPAAWPSESLTALKSSRSTYSSATAWPERRARARPEREVLVQQRAVRQLRQRVVVGEERDLLLRAAALGDVAEGRHRAVRARLALAHERMRGDRRPHLAAVLAHDPQHDVALRQAALQRPLRRHRAVRQRLAVLQQDLHRPFAAGAVEQLLLARAENPRGGRVAREHAPVGAVDQQALLQRVHDAAVALLALRQRRLGDPRGGDVGDDPLRQVRRADLVADHRVALPHPHDAAVGGDHAVLAVERLLLAEGVARLGDHAVAVVGVDVLLPHAGVAEPALGGEAEQLLDLRRDVAEGAQLVPVGDVGDGGDRLDQRAVAGLRLLQLDARR